MVKSINSILTEPETTNFIVTKDEDGERLDQLLTFHLSQHSRVFLQNLISSGNVLVNGSSKKRSYTAKHNDEVSVTIPPPEPSGIEPADIPLHIIYEDSEMIVINKKAGIVVHPSYGHRQDTLVNALLNYNPNLSTIGGVFRPGIVHRLDKDTSGVMVIAKNDQAHHILSAQFKDRSVEKDYLCFVRGIPGKSRDEIATFVGRDPHNRKRFAVVGSNGKEAVSIYEVLEVFKFVTLVKVRIKTGRTHQVRLHMAYIGCPVVGDRTYGRTWKPAKAPAELTEFLKNLDRVMLHSSRLSLILPSGGERKAFFAPQPDEFTELEKILRRNPSL
jgi:23S rRNA pseudouridine1911/1915/1917 synthase